MSLAIFGAGLGLNLGPVQILGPFHTLILIWHRFIVVVCLTQFWPIVACECQVSDHSFVGQVSGTTCTSGKSPIWYSSIHINSVISILYQFSVFCLRTSGTGEQFDWWDDAFQIFAFELCSRQTLALLYTRSLLGPNFWLDFILRALWALRPSDPRAGDWIVC